MAIHQLSQKDFWENFKTTDHKQLSWILKIIVFLADIGQTTKATIKQPRGPKTLKIMISYNHYKIVINHSEKEDENEK